MMTQARKPAPLSPRQAAACCQPIDSRLDPSLFKALSDPTRVRILGCLIKCGRPCSVSETAECCDVDLSVVSRHLQLLVRAGIAQAVKDGRVVSYSIRHDHLSQILRDLADSIDQCHAPKRREPPRAND